MLDKFVNGKLSEKDETKLLESFYKKEEELAFKEKWNDKFSNDKGLNKIDEFNTDSDGKLIHISPREKGGLIRKLNSNFVYKISAAVIIVLIGVSSVFIQQGDFVQGYKYEYLIKGKRQEYKKCDKIADLIETKLENIPNISTPMWLLYKKGKYSKVINQGQKSLLQNPRDESTLLIAVIAAIRSNRYDDSFELLQKYPIYKESQFHKEYKSLYDLNRIIVE